MGTDRSRSQRQRLPKLQRRHSHGPHITALSPNTTEASPHCSRQEGDVHLCHPETPPGNTHQHKHAQNIHDLVRKLLWAQPSPCDFVLHTGHRIRFENFVYVARCGVQTFGTCQECSLQTALQPSHCDFLNFFSVFLFISL